MLNLKISLNGIVSFTDLNQGSEMIFFELILTTFEAPIPYEAAGAIAKIFLSLKLKPLWKIKLAQISETRCFEGSCEHLRGVLIFQTDFKSFRSPQAQT